MANVTALVPTTVTQLAGAIPEKWVPSIILDAHRGSFWGDKEGQMRQRSERGRVVMTSEGQGMPIVAKQDFSKTAMDTLNFTCVAGLRNRGVTGTTKLRGKEEQLRIGNFTLTVDFLRHAVALDKKVKLQVLPSVLDSVKGLLTLWMMKRIDDDMNKELITNSNVTKVYAGNATDDDSMGSNDTFGVDELDKIKQQLIKKGAIPIRIIRKNGRNFPCYGVLISAIDEFHLKDDQKWIDAQKDAWIRGEDNPLFSGAYGYYDGMLVYTLPAIGDDMPGSPLRPEGILESAITAASTTIEIGTSNPTESHEPFYTEFFDDIGEVTVTGTKYIQIEDEVIKYTGKNRYQFTGCTRGQLGTTAAAHAAGCYVTQRNLSYAIGFGGEIAARGWGEKPIPIGQVDDYGMVSGVGIEAVFGQSPIENQAGNLPNYLIMRCYAENLVDTS